MSYKEIKGNIFNSRAMAIVNTVNCVGAMGKGIALDFKLRFPEMFKEYQKICFQKLLRPGQILPYKKSNPIILNFAIKDDWKEPSRREWIEETLQKFVNNYKAMGITSIAFPWMGAMNGGLPIEYIKETTRKFLSSLEDIDIEVYEFDPKVPCHLFLTLKEILSRGYSLTQLAESSEIKPRYWEKIVLAMSSGNVASMNDICHYIVNGKRIIGKTNIERLFHFLSKWEAGRITITETLF